MSDPKIPKTNEREMLRAAVGGLDARDLKRAGKICYTEWLAAKERARITLMNAQAKDVQYHSWKGHFDVTRLI